MDTLPLSSLIEILILLLLLSAFFSLSETAMMAANRYKLRHLAQSGHLGARLSLTLLARTDRLLGVILLGNNLVNTAAAALVSFITLRFFGADQWALMAATLLMTLAILIFSEVTPKIIGAVYADRLCGGLGFVFAPLLRVFYPLVWFVNLFAGALLRLLGLSLHPGADTLKLTQGELRMLVMESRDLIPPAHGSLLLNLFDLGQAAVNDVMTPRGQIEILDVAAPWEDVRQRLLACRYRALPVCEGNLDHLLGVLLIRQALPYLNTGEYDAEMLKAQLSEPYYIPAGTSLIAQIRFFQENRKRFGFVVDEYGEILGMLTLEDIVEEIVGEFSSALPGSPQALEWSRDGSVIVEGGVSLRELNRKLKLSFPLQGPKTLNGLILDTLEEIPDARVCVRLGEVAVEVMQSQDRSVKTARLWKVSPGKTGE
ncbi:MAG: CNNM domain-containing protein [Zoogloeaceae bacterium]|nr:CNNM domain-containing protein [Zoogloeaceae bacterium]